MKYLIWGVVLMLVGCGPAIYQRRMPAPSDNNFRAFSLTGYTEIGETDPVTATNYVKAAIRDSCTSGEGRIKRLDTYPSQNWGGLGKFLYWETVFNCDGPLEVPRSKSPKQMK